ncbi:hypothetical protein [Rubripirellula reticaptiva]|uniref:Uncharacterized protein n=1 Tax=Rubripirellula reticaptiva TaxID=2528013 RepID=A0A5C6EUT7_9BACT|nr:hypothetical protein [Rubripirellula reticaptiva]TWU51817.1 hypothetical protein Poly59_34120 [Rubripirellula reticaptiva]
MRTTINHTRRIGISAAIAVFLTIGVQTSAQAQIVTPSGAISSFNPTANLSDRLINQLRATRQDQRDYLALVIKKVENKELEARLVIAVQQYAMKRNAAFPFPYFERALQYEARKRGVVLPSLQTVASTAIPGQTRR